MKKIILTLSLVAVVATSSLFADSAKEIIEKNGCMSCHNIMGMKDAPPFAGISWRSSRLGSDAKETLKHSIKNGSQGKYPMFSNTKMPAFSNISEKDLDTLATWILSQSSNMNNNMMGKCGAGMNRNSNRCW